jgi:hypothetical protein
MAPCRRKVAAMALLGAADGASNRASIVRWKSSTSLMIVVAIAGKEFK